MEFADVVRKRRMVRNFTDEPVPEATIERIIATSQRAPSAGFSQGVTFVTVTNPETRAAIGTLAGEDEFYVAGGFDPSISRAPVHVVICVNEQLYHDRYREADKVDEEGNEIEWPVPYWHTDAGCSLMLLLLAAVNEGLGAAFVGVWRQRDLQELLGIPGDFVPIGVTLLGHPAPDKRSGSLKRGFRSLDTIWHKEHWQAAE